MSSTDFVSLMMGLVVLLVTAVGISATISLTRISHLQATDAYHVLQIQQFETTFFNLLNTHNNSVKNLKYWYPDGNQIAGGFVFEVYQKQLQKSLDFERSDTTSLFEYEHAYDQIYYEFMTPMDFYIGNLDMLALFIDRRNFKEEERRFYYSIVASQLNDTERVILQYHIKLRVFRTNLAQRERLKRILWSTGTISLSDHHDFILDPDISKHADDEEYSD